MISCQVYKRSARRRIQELNETMYYYATTLTITEGVLRDKRGKQTAETPTPGPVKIRLINRPVPIPLSIHHQFIHFLIKLTRILESIPNLLWNILERFLKSLRAILPALIHLCHTCNLPDEDRTNPAGVFSVQLAVRLGIRLCAVADADKFTAREPTMDLLHSVSFVGLCTLSQVG